MIIEREGKKFWAPDSATFLDVSGKWILDDTQLVPWDIYEATLMNDALTREKLEIEGAIANQQYADINVQNEILQYAVEQYNEPIIGHVLQLQERLAEINRLLV